MKKEIIFLKCNTFFLTTYYISYKGKQQKKKIKQNIFLYERGSRLCQKIEDAVDSDLVMIVAGL